MTTNNINENQGTEQKENLSISPGVVKLLDSIGITTNEATLKNLEESLSKSRSLFESFKEDGNVVKQNPSEKSRFELLYLKGFGQVVNLKDGRVMSFTDIAKLKGAEKDAVIDGMSRSEKIKFKEWDLEAANQEETKIDTALDQQTERLNILSAKAKSLMDTEGIQFLSDELQKIQSSPESSPIVENLIRQGAKMEDIQSGKYNGIIESRIIIENEDIFLQKHLNNKDKATEFRALVNEMRGYVGVSPTPQNIDRFLGSKVLGEGREAVGTAMHEIGKTGNYDRMIWDEDTRAVIFQGKNGEQVRIDTASIPPRLTRSQDPLSISHDAEALSQEELEQKQKKENAEKLGEKGSNAYNESISAYVTGRTAEYELPGETRELFLRENGELDKDYKGIEQSLMTGQDTKKRGEQIDELTRINESMKRNTLDKLLETGDSENRTRINRMLEERSENLRHMKQANAIIHEADESLLRLGEKTSENRYERFYAISGSNLSTMADTRLHKMGPRAQEAIDRIITEINRTRDSGNQIKLDEKRLDSSDRRILKTMLERLGGTEDVLRSERIGVFQKNINLMLAKAPRSPGSIEDKMQESPSEPTP